MSAYIASSVSSISETARRAIFGQSDRAGRRTRKCREQMRRTHLDGAMCAEKSYRASRPAMGAGQERTSRFMADSAFSSSPVPA